MAERKFDLRNYVGVHERIGEFADKHPEGSLQQLSLEFREVDGRWWVIYTAAAYRSPEDLRPGHGTAWEQIPGKTSYTRNSEVQNAETSAWGRAIVAALAADTKGGIASREEMARTGDDDGYEPDAWFIQNGWESQAQHDEWRKSALAHLKYDADLRRSFNEFREGGTLRVSSFADGPHPTDEAEAIQTWLCERNRHHFVSQSEGLDACADCGERAPF